MVASGLAARVMIPLQMEHDESYKKYAEHRVMRELGDALMEQLANNDTYLVAKLHASWEKTPSWDYIRGDTLTYYGRIDLSAANTKYVCMAEYDPELSNTFRTFYENKDIQVEWGCAYCGMTNLVKDHLECRKCGAPRKPIRGI